MEPRYPSVDLTDETMREGMQIESTEISVADKARLIDALSDTGLKRLSIGSFVNPKYTPQMAQVEELMRSFSPRKGVKYSALALNEKGIERAKEFTPPLEPRGSGRASLSCHLSDVFARRNINRSQQQEIDRWPTVVESAVANGAKTAGIGLIAAFGSNFEGPYSNEDRMSKLREQHELWDEVGIPVTSISLGDPMSWCMPNEVEDQLVEILETWPDIVDFGLHLHNARGMAIPCTYVALRLLKPGQTLRVQSTLGGIGGCPYCGNGRATGMAPTEDLVAMLEEMGIDTGVDIESLIRAVWLLEEILGRPTMGHVSKAGPRPRGSQLYDANLPFIETFEEARHFLDGEECYSGAMRPWTTPIPSPFANSSGS